MKAFVIMGLSFAMLGTCCSLVQAQESPELRKFMRAKLVHSQELLKGLVTEDLNAVAKQAQDMAMLSQDASWKVIQTAEYLQRSNEFRRTCETMETAKKGNLDAATLAYVKVTLQCVDCHKYVRRVRHAQRDEPAKLR